MPASFLKIGGELVRDAILQLVEVTQEINQHWWCRVECRQTEDRRVPVEDLLGHDLQIVTRDQGGAEHVVFDGFVLEASLLYEVFGSHTARLKAVTRSYKLDLTAQEAYYRKQTLSGVAQSLCGADGLAAEVLAKDGVKRNYAQWGEPDFRFLVRIADDHQAWIRPTAQGIQICDAFQRGVQVIWRQEDGLLAFDVEGGLAPPAFDGTHFDARQMRSVTHIAVSKPAEYFAASGPMLAAVERQSKTKLTSGAAFMDGRAATAEEYKALLERESIRAAVNRVIGHGISHKEDLKAGDTVEIAGVLDGKGTYGLTKVIHRWNQKGYENEFWCIPSKTYMAPQPPAPAEVPGVVTARVVEHNDPRKMGRIQVQYDWQENGPTGWVRATTPHAGQDRGFLFMPEIGDEVVIAFEHGDPERPYVVGSLWNGLDQAPRDEFWGADVEPNDVKRIVTKSGHRIQLVDKPGKESIVIATPQHLKIALIEKADETGRSMILLHSDGDIFINAPGGRVHLHSASLSQDVGGGGSGTAAAKKSTVATATRSGVAGLVPSGPSGGTSGGQDSVAAPLAEQPTPLSKEVLAALSNSPTFVREWQHLHENGWRIVYGVAGKGSSINRLQKTILIDHNQAGDPTQIATTIAHEIGHARRAEPPSTPIGTLGRAEFVRVNTNPWLLGEADATITNITIKNEVAQSGHHIDVAGAQSTQFERIYNEHRGQLSKARQPIANLYATGEHASVSVKGHTEKLSYREYYGTFYEDYYDKYGPKRLP